MNTKQVLYGLTLKQIQVQDVLGTKELENQIAYL